MTRIHKAPRTFVFAVKSTDPISLFENKADYLHVFSCSEDVGRHWLESILLARVSLCILVTHSDVLNFSSSVLYSVSRTECSVP